jgi:rubrerythrin
MARILVVDRLQDECEALKRALGEAGWEVVVADDAAACRTASADAIVLAADAADLARAHAHVEAVREELATPVILVADFDRSGWDRTFTSPEALNVDALFDRPVDAQALVRRLAGILAAREDARLLAAAPEMSSIVDRAIVNEEAAAAFYRRAAERISDPQTKEVLESLMRDEQEHKRLLQEFRSGARPLPDATVQTTTLVEVFGAPQFSEELAPSDALLLAANKERLAVEFYENWAKLYPDGEERRLLLYLANVERGHKVRVEAMFANAAFPESW